MYDIYDMKHGKVCVTVESTTGDASGRNTEYSTLANLPKPLEPIIALLLTHSLTHSPARPLARSLTRSLSPV